MDLEKFTERSRGFLNAAQTIAMRESHQRLVPEHLLRALMEKGLVNFGEKSELPGKPMYYETTRKFLEIFSLRNLNELPSLSQIDELLPEGITVMPHRAGVGARLGRRYGGPVPTLRWFVPWFVSGVRRV